MQILTFVQRQWIEFFSNKGQGPRDEQVYQIQERLNNRPRKKLGYLTPNEALAAAVKPLTGALNP